MTTATLTVEQHLSRLGVTFKKLTHDGDEYVITTRTGERYYDSALGGSAAFAYCADDESDANIASYSDFCEIFSPVEDRGVALAAARLGLRVTSAGACTPILSDEEFLAAR